MVVEAAGVELSSVLRTRKLLIVGTATKAQKAPLPNPLYVYCTKMLSRLIAFIRTGLGVKSMEHKRTPEK
jgi:hypothetical protein